MSETTRVAAVGYTNAWPLLTRLDRIAYRVMEGHPAEVARLLTEGEADVGLVPVAALLSGTDWRVVPGYCIGAEGPVKSVLLVGQTAPENWTRLVLDGVSRSSVVLSQVLARRGQLGCSTDIEVVHVGPGEALDAAGPTDGALVIGDAARALPARFTSRVDLGERWHAFTGLPFVFAVWAGRPDLSHTAIAGLRRAAMEGLAMREHLPEPDRSYVIDDIRYALDDKALCGLRRFAALAVEEGLLADKDVELYGPATRSLARPDVGELLIRAARGDTLGPEHALVLALGATTSDLTNAATLRRFSLHPERRVSLTEGEEHRVSALFIGAGETVDRRVDALLALGDAHAVTVLTSTDLPYTDDDNTTANQIRWSALARLLLPRVAHIVADNEDAGIAQALLWAGCNDWGRASDVAEAERQIRAAGFDPVERNADFEVVGGARTSGKYAGSRSQVRGGPN